MSTTASVFHISTCSISSLPAITSIPPSPLSSLKIFLLHPYAPSPAHTHALILFSTPFSPPSPLPPPDNMWCCTVQRPLECGCWSARPDAHPSKGLLSIGGSRSHLLLYCTLFLILYQTPSILLTIFYFTVFFVFICHFIPHRYLLLLLPSSDAFTLPLSRLFLSSVTPLSLLLAPNSPVEPGSPPNRRTPPA
jgi:hypothetical protein